MAEDIVDELRGWAEMFRGGYAQKLARTAADEIVELRKIICRYVDAVEDAKSCAPSEAHELALEKHHATIALWKVAQR